MQWAEISLNGLNDEERLERESKGSPNEWTRERGKQEPSEKEVVVRLFTARITD